MRTPLVPSRQNLVTSLVLLVLSSCDTSGPSCASSGAGGASAPPPEPRISYSPSSLQAWEGAPYTSPTPTVENLVVHHFFVQPTLPPGLVIDEATGVISGTPVAAEGESEYTVYAFVNPIDAGAATLVSLIVHPPAPPSGLAYNPSSLTVAQGAAIPQLVPTFANGAASFTVTPQLPAGLTLHPTTGRISGVVASPPGTTQHVITAANPYGADEAALELEVLETLVVRGYATLCGGEPVIDVFVGRGAGAAPLDALVAGGPVGVAATGTPDGRFVFAALSNGRLVRAARDPRSGRTGPLTDLGDVGVVEELLVPSDGATLVVVQSNTVRRYDLAPDGAISGAVEVPAGLFVTAAHVVDGVLVLGSSAPGRLAAFELRPNLAQRGVTLELGADVLVSGLEDFDGSETFYAATSTYDVQLHAFSGAVRQLRVSTAGAVAAGAAALVPVRTIAVGGDLTDLELARTSSFGGTLYITDGTQGRVHRLAVDEFAQVSGAVIGSTAVGGRPAAIAPGLSGAQIAIVDEERAELALYDVTSGGAPTLSTRTRTRPQPFGLVPLLGTDESAAEAFADDLFVVSAADATLRAARSDLAAVGGVTLAAQGPVATGARPLAVAASDDGPFVYTANRDGASLSAFRYDAATMTLSLVEHEALGAGARPVSLALTPSGRHLVAVDMTGTALGFEVSDVDGSLTPTGTAPLTGALEGASVRIDALGRFAYVSQPNASQMRVLRLDPVSGALTALGAVSSLVVPADVWLPADGRFAYAVDTELGRVVSFTVDPVDGGLSTLGAALTVSGAPKRLATDLGVEALASGIAPAMVAFDPQGERAIPVARNATSGVLVAAQPSGPTLALPSEASAIATLSRATRALGATLVVTSDSAGGASLTAFGLDGGAWVQGGAAPIGNGPHALATRVSVR